MAEEGKQLSKKEQKRLAKKAEKEAQKKNKDKGNNTPANDKPSSSAPSVGSAPLPPKETVYYLANASSQECPSALKATIAASAFGMTLCRASSATHDIPSLLHGPALFANSNTSNIAFGGNGIAKAISLITSQGGANLAVVDEWLELERTSLRSTSAKTKAAALTKIETALSSSSGYFLVGSTLTIADIAVVVTLSQSKDTYAPAIQSYVNTHLSSDVFQNGKTQLTNLIPPPPFDVLNNPSMTAAVSSVFYTAISNLLPQLAHTLAVEDVIEKSKQLKFGDYQCKEAMPLFSKLKASNSLPVGVNSPQQLAQAIVDQIPDQNPVIDSIVINGPGFILCKVKSSYLECHVNKLMNSATQKESNNDSSSSSSWNDPKLPLPLNVREKNQTVVVDFSSPNIAKEMHVGHLRSTIIGETVCRILELVGADVKRVNHVGDWGTQFGMLITYLKEAYPEFASGDSSDIPISDLTQIYKQAKVSFFRSELR